MERDSSASQTGWVTCMDKVLVFILNKIINDYDVTHCRRKPFSFGGGTII